MKHIQHSLTPDDLPPELFREVAFRGDFVALGIILGQGVESEDPVIRTTSEMLAYKVYAQLMAQGMDILACDDETSLPDHADYNFILLGMEVENLRTLASFILEESEDGSDYEETRILLDRVMNPMWEAYSEPPENERRNFDRVNLN